MRRTEWREEQKEEIVFPGESRESGEKEDMERERERGGERELA